MQLAPTLVFAQTSSRSVGMAWSFLTESALPPWHLLGALAPGVFGDPAHAYWPGMSFEWHERLLYVGVVPLLAAAWAPGRWRWLCWNSAALAIALAFGRYAPWYAWAQVLPGYPDFRLPSKHLTLAAIAPSWPRSSAAACAARRSRRSRWPTSSSATVAG